MHAIAFHGKAWGAGFVFLYHAQKKDLHEINALIHICMLKFDRIIKIYNIILYFAKQAMC
jgi:hypothetical protein